MSDISPNARNPFFSGSKPDVLKDAYWASIRKAHEAASDPSIPLELVPEFIDAAAFFGIRLKKDWDDVMTDCIDYSIHQLQLDGGGTDG